MSRHKTPSVSTPWYESGVFWGCISLAIGFDLAVISTILHNIRFLLWLAMPCFYVTVWVVIRSTVRVGLVRRWVTGVALFTITLGTLWLYKFEPEEPSMPMEQTHRTNGTSGLHDDFTLGECHRGVPDETQKAQWTWSLSGARFGCLSNDYKSFPATVDFEPGAYGEATVSTQSPLLPLGKPVRVLITWTASREHGNVKWVLSTACTNLDLDLNRVYTEVLTMVDSPVAGRLKISEGNFELDPKCTFPHGVDIQLARRGEDKEDTLPANAQVSRLMLDAD